MTFHTREKPLTRGGSSQYGQGGEISVIQ